MLFVFQVQTWGEKKEKQKQYSFGVKVYPIMNVKTSLIPIVSYVQWENFNFIVPTQKSIKVQSSAKHEMLNQVQDKIALSLPLLVIFAVDLELTN